MADCQNYQCKDCTSSLRYYCQWVKTPQGGSCYPAQVNTPRPTTCLSCSDLSCDACAGTIDANGKYCYVADDGQTCLASDTQFFPHNVCKTPTTCEAIGDCAQCMKTNTPDGKCYVQSYNTLQFCSTVPSSVTTCDCSKLSSTECEQNADRYGKCVLSGGKCQSRPPASSTTLYVVLVSVVVLFAFIIVAILLGK